MSHNFTPISLSEEFQYVLELMEHTQKHLFITGRAGTGKSTLLSLFRDTTRKKTAVLAPTGIAALKVKGQTIHSFFGFPPKLIQKKDIMKRKNHRLYKNVEVIIIDEISMVRADMIDAINYFLKVNRESHLDFGGVQMVLFGDLFQLPPIVANQEERAYISKFYDSPYFFSSRVIKNISLETIELLKIYRQEERRFINLLDNIRTLRMDYDDMEELNERTDESFETEDFYITLSPRNRVVDKINNFQLAKLDEIEMSFTARITGHFSPNVYPTQDILRLKRGAQVMFVKNDPNKKFVNGTIGKIIELNENEIMVAIEDQSGIKSIVNVETLEWEIIKYSFDEKKNTLESNITGTFKQFPLKLAWAITIHKSQGQTFDKVIIDMGAGAFEYGQTYVALSRCRTLHGIILRKPITTRDIRMDPRVAEFYQSIY